MAGTKKVRRALAREFKIKIKSFDLFAEQVGLYSSDGQTHFTTKYGTVLTFLLVIIVTIFTIDRITGLAANESS